VRKSFNDSLKVIVCLLNFFIYSADTFCQVNHSPSCDSTIYKKLEIAIDSLVNDTIRKLVVDSSSVSIIAGHKGYNLRDYGFNERRGKFPLLKSEGQLCDVKKYMYLFELLLDNGLDFEYDYYTQLNLDTIYDSRLEKGFYILAKDRFKTKEFTMKRRMVGLYFDIYEMYLNNVHEEEDPSYDELLDQVLNYSCLKYPVLTMAIMRGKPGLTEEKFGKEQIKAMKRWHKPKK
jgi:hypothetical protein